ncbi:mucin-2-like [Hydractinia symbiolongicarpus]|uniref:mucin-2-like n=1 Tax=Hydractinia symbiolongicarpus TaxID=13093 RepID=UPI00254CA6EE|nr:mucin-2-like [Hydractinia symbiolongicarpus]
MANTNGLGTIKVGSVSELANLLTGMSPEQLQNVRLDPTLYNALSQTINPATQVENADIFDIQPSNSVILSDNGINQVLTETVAAINQGNATSLIEAISINEPVTVISTSNQKVMTTNFVSSQLVSQPLNQPLPILSSVDHVQPFFLSPIEASVVNNLQQENQPLIISNMNQSTLLGVANGQHLSNTQTPINLQGILPGQGSSLIVTPTVMSQVQPTATIQTLKFTDIVETSDSTALDVNSHLINQSYITTTDPMQTFSLNNQVINTSLSNSILPSTVNINPTIVANTLQSTNAVNNAVIPNLINVSQGQQIVINGGTIVGNMLPNTVPTQQMLVPGIVETGQQVLVNEMPQQAVLIPESHQQVMVNEIPPQTVFVPAQSLNPNPTTANPILLSNNLAGTGQLVLNTSQPVITSPQNNTLQPQINVGGKTASANIIFQNGTKLALSAQQFASLLKGKQGDFMLPVNPKKVPQSLNQSSISVKSTRSNIKTSIVRKPVVVTSTFSTKSKPNIVVKTVNVISKPEAHVVQMKPKSVEQVQPGVFKFQLTAIDDNDKGQDGSNIVNVSKMVSTTRILQPVLKQNIVEGKKHKFHDYSLPKDGASWKSSVPSINPPGPSNLGEIKKNMLPSPSKNQKSASTSNTSKTVNPTSAKTTSNNNEMSTAKLLEIAKKINVKSSTSLLNVKPISGSNSVSTGSSTFKQLPGSKANIVKAKLKTNHSSITPVNFPATALVRKPQTDSVFVRVTKNNTSRSTATVELIKTSSSSVMASAKASSESLIIQKHAEKIQTSTSPRKEPIKILTSPEKTSPKQVVSSVSTAKKDNLPKTLANSNSQKRRSNSIDRELEEPLDHQLECNERDFVSPSESPLKTLTLFNRSFKKTGSSQVENKTTEVVTTCTDATLSKEVTEIISFREAIQSSKVGGEEAMRQLAKLEIENQLKRFHKSVEKNDDKTANTTKQSDQKKMLSCKKTHVSTAGEHERKSLKVIEETDCLNKTNAPNASLTSNRPVKEVLIKEKEELEEVTKKNNTKSVDTTRVNVAKMKTAKVKIMQAKCNFESRKRERPKKFDDFVLPVKPKKEKKSRKFFFPKCEDEESNKDLSLDSNEPIINKSMDLTDHAETTTEISTSVQERQISKISDNKNENINKTTNSKKIPKKRKHKQHQLAIEPEVLPAHLKTKPKKRVLEDAVIDLTKVRLKSAFAETVFTLNDTVEYKTYKLLSKSKCVCTLCGKPGNLGNLDVLFGPYKLKVRTKDVSKNIVMNVWVHRDCAIWTSSVCLSNQMLCGLGDALETAARTACALCSQVGATLECGFKQCRDGYHFVCAKQRGCSFKMENFTIVCPKHR